MTVRVDSLAAVRVYPQIPASEEVEDWIRSVKVLRPLPEDGRTTEAHMKLIKLLPEGKHELSDLNFRIFYSFKVIKIYNPKNGRVKVCIYQRKRVKNCRSKRNKKI